MSENKKDNMRGSVLIVGSGIGGIQAALDLANSGFKVHMTERKAAIGGIMAQLDKTFPTGDCSMCMISPKLVENRPAPQHRNPYACGRNRDYRRGREFPCENPQACEIH